MHTHEKNSPNFTVQNQNHFFPLFFQGTKYAKWQRKIEWASKTVPRLPSNLDASLILSLLHK